MKCIRCQHDSRAKERTAGLCPKCQGQFAFERGEKFTDAAFQSAMDAVSSGGRLRWGVEHLYYELNRRRRKVLSVGCLIVPALIALGTATLAVCGGPGVEPGERVVFAIIALVTGLVAAGVIGDRLRVTARLDRPAFEALWSRWVAVHGAPAGVILRPDQPRPARASEADVGDYSFDRAVICDRARTVDLLLANNFHFENNCAVLSMGGYPPGPFETVRAMLRRNPRLQVFALHDATPEGCRMAHLLASDPRWFATTARVTDVGLRPGHDGPHFRGLKLEATATVSPGLGVSSDEARWLSRWSLELAAIRPEQVLKRLFRALSRRDDESGDVGVGGDGGVREDHASFSRDVGDSDGGADSFG